MRPWDVPKNFRSGSLGTGAGTSSSITDAGVEARAMAEQAGGIKALLLAAGLGTRLRPITDTLPKCLVPIGGRALLDIWVECLIQAGIAEARINTHALAAVVRAHIDGVNSRGRLHLVESYEPVLLGSAGTITANADLADGVDDVVIIYADNLSDLDLRPLIVYHRRHGDPLTMVLFKAPQPRGLRHCRAGRSGTDRFIRRETHGAGQRPGKRRRLRIDRGCLPPHCRDEGI